MRQHPYIPPNSRLARWRPALIAALAGATLLLAVLPLLAGPRRTTAAAVIPIRGEITDVLKDSIARRVEQSRADGAKTLIFEIDTLGGLVTSALDICQLIKSQPDDVHTVAWIHPKAYSAGAMIALSCNEILMSKRSAIGDCAPIMVSPTGGLEGLPPAERAKAESPILEEFRDSALRNGYPPLLCRAMVTVGEEVWWVERVDTGERRFVTGAEKTTLLEEQKDGQPQWRLVEKYHDPVSGRDEAVRQPVDAADSLLTLAQGEAVAYGIASGIAPDLDAVAEHLGLATPPVYHEIQSWEKFVMWLNSPLVRGLLFMIVLVGAYVEFQHPGLILPGATAAVALLIFLAAPYAAGLADIWTFVLLGIGLVLLAIEIFVIPGFGVLGLIGGVLVLIALIGTFVPREPDAPLFSWPRLPGTWEALKYGVAVLSGSVIVAFMGILLLLRYLPQLAAARRLIPANPDGASLVIADPFEGVALPGDLGIVTGDLRPGGQARFGQHIVDVQSQGEYVPAGRRVQVLQHIGMRIVVRPLPDEPTA